MPERINSEWRIDKLKRMIELLKEADEKQLDLIELLVAVHTEPLRRRPLNVLKDSPAAKAFGTILAVVSLAHTIFPWQN